MCSPGNEAPLGKDEELSRIQGGFTRMEEHPKVWRPKPCSVALRPATKNRHSGLFPGIWANFRPTVQGSRDQEGGEDRKEKNSFWSGLATSRTVEARRWGLHPRLKKLAVGDDWNNHREERPILCSWGWGQNQPKKSKTPEAVSSQQGWRNADSKCPAKASPVQVLDPWVCNPRIWGRCSNSPKETLLKRLPQREFQRDVPKETYQRDLLKRLTQRDCAIEIIPKRSYQRDVTKETSPKRLRHATSPSQCSLTRNSWYKQTADCYSFSC